jgi:molybdate transport system substrate-binding protein
MRRMLRLIVAALVLLAPAAWASAQEVIFSAAISMKDAVEDLGRGFAAARPGLSLRFNFGSSGELQKQIEAGAPVDLFISARPAADGRVAAQEPDRGGQPSKLRPQCPDRHQGVGFQGRSGEARRSARLPGQKIVIGNPKTVPVGQYSEESLRALGLWERVQPKLVLAENVRQALDYVARGEVDAGFVYTTDAAIRPGQVVEAFRPAEDTYRPVVYPVAVVAGSKHQPVAQAFIGLLIGRVGQSVLARFGSLRRPPGHDDEEAKVRLTLG